jgi:hypothetical protein
VSVNVAVTITSHILVLFVRDMYNTGLGPLGDYRGEIGYADLGIENLRNRHRHQNLKKRKLISTILIRTSTRARQPMTTQTQNACIARGYSLVTKEVKDRYGVSSAGNGHIQTVFTPELNSLCDNKNKLKHEQQILISCK